MTTNAIAISRSFVEAGIEKKAADAIAEAMVTHSDETFATKADLARLEGNLGGKIEALSGQVKALTAQVKILTFLVTGLYVGLALLFMDRILGG